MAWIRVRRRVPEMGCKSHSLDSTGRSGVEHGEEVNSRVHGKKPAADIIMPITISDHAYFNLCKKCGERFKLKKDLTFHLKLHNAAANLKKPANNKLEEPPRMTFTPPNMPESLKAYLDKVSAPRRRGKPAADAPLVDLTLRVGRIVDAPRPRGRPRRLPLPIAPSRPGPSRQLLWFKEYAMYLKLAGNNLGKLLNTVGDVQNIVSFCQTLSDKELELKLGFSF